MNLDENQSGSFGWFIEFVFWIKIFLSPFLAGILLGAIIIFSLDSNLGVNLAIVSITIGFIS